MVFQPSATSKADTLRMELGSLPEPCSEGVRVIIIPVVV